MSLLRLSALLSLALLAAGLPLRAEVVINEIHFDPPDKTALEEFIELHNAGEVPVDISGWYFSEGIDFVVPDKTTIAPGEYLVVAEDPAAFQARWGGVRVLGPYGGNLSAGGERIVLRNRLGAKEDEVDYGVGFPWPVAAAGDGGSMELIHPLLDNDLGGSWRASGPPASLPEESFCYLEPEDGSWRYRKGTSEASDPPSAWRTLDFVEDGTWLTGQTSIGFGDDDDRTLLDDMQNAYSSVYLRHAFTIDPGRGVPEWLKLRLFVDDGCIIWINGVEVLRANVPPGERAFNDLARSHEARWEERLLAGPSSYLLPGANMLAIHAFNVSLSSNDFSIDAAVCVPARSELPPEPTPGRRNSVYSAAAPPQIRQVGHRPQQPPAGQPFLVTAKVTDPEGVAAVTLSYQAVLPGQFVPAFIPHEPAALMARPDLPPPPNPAFEDPANWAIVPMADDGRNGDAVRGDGIFTAAVPPQINRTLVRYRIRAEDAAGASIIVPYPDDGSLNFACFVYDGVPPYVPARQSVHPDGPGHVYPPEILTSLPVYFLITRAEDIARCVAYNSAWQIPKGSESARDAFNWEGAFVYEGVVYDHVRYRLRQANDRYGGTGKRSWRIRFHRGRWLEARDNHGRRYPTRWRTLNIGKMFDNKRVGNFGLTETLNHILWNRVGVPAPFVHTFHFRVVDGVEEAPAGPLGQFQGDFWGMALAMEDYDARFLDAHDLADGTLYKLKDGIFDGRQLKRNQGRFAVTTDEDFQNIRQNLRPFRTPDWLNAHVNYSRWYPYHAVVEAIRHYDFVPADSHSKNRAWYFEPDPSSRLGRLWTLPWDSDASWGPNWNDGIDYSKNAIFADGSKSDFRREYRSAVRSFRDLVWQEDVVHAMIDDLAAIVAGFSQADRDRWRGGPPDAGSQDYGAIEAKVIDMKRFAFIGWSGGSGPTVPAGGRAAYLDILAAAEGDAAQIPHTPAVASTAPPGFPIDRLTFEVSAFGDPQGDGTFGAIEWRLGEVTDPAAPAHDPALPRLHEVPAVWESGALPTFEKQAAIPMTRVQPGHAYRVRARMMDATGRWSHWSPPVQFIAGQPEGSIAPVEHLRVSEVMYNPAGGGDEEFIEVVNTGPEPLDLREVRFQSGIDFAFAGSAVETLGPGEYAVVVKNLALFSARYRTGDIRIAGEYGGRLDNGGEEIRLVHGLDLSVLRFAYDDAWHPATDGLGHSLTIIDPLAPPERWSQPDGWKPSSALHGSPGGPDAPAPSLQVPGDITQDGALDISDPIGILVHLFLGTLPVLPCGGGTLAEPSNAALLDASGDRAVDITDAVYLLEYLFLGGPPHVLGAECAPIPGCPPACRG